MCKATCRSPPVCSRHSRLSASAGRPRPCARRSSVSHRHKGLSVLLSVRCPPTAVPAAHSPRTETSARPVSKSSSKEDYALSRPSERPHMGRASRLNDTAKPVISISAPGPEPVIPEPLWSRAGHSRGAERSAGEPIHLWSGHRLSKTARHRTAPVCARAERTPKLRRPDRRSRRTTDDSDARRACTPPTRRRDRSQRCFTIGQALSLSGRAAFSAGTVARSLR